MRRLTYRQIIRNLTLACGDKPLQKFNHAIYYVGFYNARICLYKTGVTINLVQKKDYHSNSIDQYEDGLGVLFMRRYFLCHLRLYRTSGLRKLDIGAILIPEISNVYLRSRLRHFSDSSSCGVDTFEKSVERLCAILEPYLLVAYTV